MEESYFLDKKGFDLFFDLHARSLKRTHDNSIFICIVYVCFFSIKGFFNYYINETWWVFVLDFSMALTFYIIWSFLRKPLENFKKLALRDKEELLYSSRVSAEIDKMEDLINNG